MARIKKFFEFRLQLAFKKLISPEKEINLCSEKIQQNLVARLFPISVKHGEP